MTDKLIFWSKTWQAPVRIILFAAIGGLLLFSRNPDHFLHPQLWAEDGSVWLQQAYTDGVASLFRPQAGYLQIFSRLCALSATALPLTAIPLFFVILSFAIQLLPALMLLSERGQTLIPSLTIRVILAVWYIGEPNSYEIYLNLTNAMWHLALAALLILMMPKTKSRLLQIFDITVLILIGLSGTLVIFITPIAWWQCLRSRRSQIPGELRLRVSYALLVSGFAVLQAGCLLANDAQRPRSLDASISGFVHIIANQVVLGGSIGQNNALWFWAQPFWHGALWPTLVCLAAAGTVAIAFAYGPTAYRQFVVFSGLTMAAALDAPIVSLSNQWQMMQFPGAGQRYYIYPMLAWFMGVLVLAVRPSRNWPLVPVLGIFLIGAIADWRYPDLPPTGYFAVATRFDAAPPGTVMTFPENPRSWADFTLRKK